MWCVGHLTIHLSSKSSCPFQSGKSLLPPFCRQRWWYIVNIYCVWWWISEDCFMRVLHCRDGQILDFKCHCLLRSLITKSLCRQSICGRGRWSDRKVQRWVWSGLNGNQLNCGRFNTFLSLERYNQSFFWGWRDTITVSFIWLSWATSGWTGLLGLLVGAFANRAVAFAGAGFPILCVAWIRLLGGLPKAKLLSRVGLS